MCGECSLCLGPERQLARNFGLHNCNTAPERIVVSVEQSSSAGPAAAPPAAGTAAPGAAAPAAAAITAARGTKNFSILGCPPPLIVVYLSAPASEVGEDEAGRRRGVSGAGACGGGRPGMMRIWWLAHQCMMAVMREYYAGRVVSDVSQRAGNYLISHLTFHKKYGTTARVGSQRTFAAVPATTGRPGGAAERQRGVRPRIGRWPPQWVVDGPWTKRSGPTPSSYKALEPGRRNASVHST